MKKQASGIALCLLLVLSAAKADDVATKSPLKALFASTGPPSDCPADSPCTCDKSSQTVNCDGPSLTIKHITFDEVPPLKASNLVWKTLNFSNNFIHAIHDKPFEKLSSVSTIDLSNNQVGDVNVSAFAGVANTVENLNLNNNQITEFPDEALLAMSLGKLKNIDLGNNLIKTVSDEAVTFLKTAIKTDPNLKINLMGNPFACDCQLKTFVNFMKSNFKNIENPHDLKCVTPANLAGRVLGALVDEELICYVTLAPATTKQPDQIFPPACPAKSPCWCDFIGNIFCSKGDMLDRNVTFTEVPHIIDLSEWVWSFLHLSGHKITTVKTLAIFPLRTKRLSLTNNLISTIQEGAFFGTELYLEMLLLEGNKLSSIPDPVLELPMLNVLDISLNDIFIIEKEKVQKLHDLIYSDVQGEIIKHDFRGKFGRNAFNCTCEMWYFHEFVLFNRENFQDLNLMFCMFGLTEETKHVRIDSLTKDNFPGCVTPTPPPDPTMGPHPDDPCPAVHPCWCTYNGDVICSGNLLLPPKNCPTGNCEPPKLEEMPRWRIVKEKDFVHSGIYIDSNIINTIPSRAFMAIDKTPPGQYHAIRTVKVDFTDNRIHYIASDAFEGLEQDLEEVILTINFLPEVPEALFSMHMLETLDLSFNHIQSYHADNIRQMQNWRKRWIHNGTHMEETDQRKSVQLRLGSNHLICNVELCALRAWVDQAPWDFVAEEELHCLQPTKWFGKPLMDLPLRELGCDTSVDINNQLQSALDAKHTMAGLFAFTFLVCLALGAYLFYLSRYKLKSSPVPVQFKNPLSNATKKDNKDNRVLVRENEYATVDAPVSNKAFGDSL